MVCACAGGQKKIAAHYELPLSFSKKHKKEKKREEKRREKKSKVKKVKDNKKKSKKH
jgi:hypothetical protein